MAKKDRDYSIKDIEIDPRLKVIRKEMIISFLMLTGFMFTVTGSSYLLWDGGEVADYSFILGMPSYFAIPALLSIGWWIVMILVIYFYYSPVDMSPYIEKEEDKND